MANLFDVYNDGLLMDHTEGEKLETGETPITIIGLTADTTYDKVQVAYAGSYNKSDVPSFKTNLGRNLGRNLLLDTARSFTGIGNNSVNGNFNAQGGKYYLAGDKKVSDLYNQYGSSGYLTLSFDWVASGTTISGKFNPVWNDTPWGGLSTSDGVQPSSTNTSGNYKATVSLKANGYSTGIATSIMFRQDNLQGNVTISNVKLESGNKATPWIPAPEDNVT